MTAGYLRHPADLRAIEHALSLPPHTLKTVERRRNGAYALILDRPRVTWWARHPDHHQQLRRLGGRRVLQLPRRTVHGGRGGRGHRNRRIWSWILLWFPCAPAADPAWMRDGQHDELRHALIRASHVGTIRQVAREAARELERAAADHEAES